MSMPSCPCFLKPTCSGKILGYGRVPPTTSRECLTNSGDLSGSANGVSANVLPAYFVERRLRVEGLHLADAAGEEHPDDRLRLRRRGAACRRAARHFASRGEAVAVQHRAERQAGEAQPDVGEERAAVHDAGRTDGPWAGDLRGASVAVTSYRTVTKSVWLNSACTRFSRAAARGRRTARRVASARPSARPRSPRTARAASRGTSRSRSASASRGGRHSTCSNAARTNAVVVLRGRGELARERAAQLLREVAVGQRERLLRQHRRACGGTRRTGWRRRRGRGTPSGLRRGARSTGCGGATPAPDPAGSPGRPTVASSSPATASRLSRTASASSRLVGNRQR